MQDKITAAYQRCIRDGHKPTGVHIHMRKEKIFIGKGRTCLLLHIWPTPLPSVETASFQTQSHRGECLESATITLSLRTWIGTVLVSLTWRARWLPQSRSWAACQQVGVWAISWAQPKRLSIYLSIICMSFVISVLLGIWLSYWFLASVNITAGFHRRCHSCLCHGNLEDEK